MGVIPSPSAGTAGEESDAAPFEQQIPRRTLKRRAPRDDMSLAQAAGHGRFPARDDMSLAQASGGAGSQLRMTGRVLSGALEFRGRLDPCAEPGLTRLQLHT